MAITYTLIASNTLFTSAASVTFSAIPNTFTDLVLRVSARNDRAVVNGAMVLRFNGSSSSVYSWTELTGNGSAAASARASSSTSLQGFALAGSSATSNTFTNTEIYIPSYTVSQNKPVSGISVNETNATAADMYATANLFSSTSAISSIELSNVSTFQFVSGSSFFLYGIRNN